MPRAIRIHETGGPEVLRLEDVPVGAPGAGEVRLRHTAIAVNFVDTYHRTGLYPLKLPVVIGVEAAGVVEAVGPGVQGLSPGDRVVYLTGSGAYAEVRLAPADRCIRLPDGVSDLTAAATFMKGLTVDALVRRTHPVKAGEAVLVHAAAGGVGLLMVPWLKSLGATVIGTAGSDEKAAIARAAGCDHVIVYSREPFAPKVRELTGGEGVPVVYDGVGKATFEGSLDSLAPFGLLVAYGNASGPVPPFDLRTLAAKGSLYVTRPTVFGYVAKRPDLERGAKELFDRLLDGRVKVAAPRTWPMAEVAAAHRALEARATTGSVVLVP
ncbi:MAG: quinone oxidoreductase [Anaeromyxobacter sp.]